MASKVIEFLILGGMAALGLGIIPGILGGFVAGFPFVTKTFLGNLSLLNAVSAGTGAWLGSQIVEKM